MKLTDHQKWILAWLREHQEFVIQENPITRSYEMISGLNRTPVRPDTFRYLLPLLEQVSQPGKRAQWRLKA
jgi:hypothetical protein